MKYNIILLEWLSDHEHGDAVVAEATFDSQPLGVEEVVVLAVSGKELEENMWRISLGKSAVWGSGSLAQDRFIPGFLRWGKVR